MLPRYDFGMDATLTLKLDERLLKPGAAVEIGPEGSPIQGKVCTSRITLYGDQSMTIEYEVEWWDDRVRHLENFWSHDVVAV